MPSHCVNCGREPTIKAHIVPAGIGRLIRAESSGNVKISFDGSKPTQLGLFDKEILCAICDNHLGKYDKYSIKELRDFRKNCTRKTGNRFVHLSLDCKKFSVFLLSVAWRSSKSTRPELSTFDLGEYEARVGDILFERMPIEALEEVNILVCLHRLKFPDLRLIYSLPYCGFDEGALIVGFAMAGIGVRIYFGDHSDLKYKEGFSLNRSKILTGAYIDFERTADGKMLIELIKSGSI